MISEYEYYKQCQAKAPDDLFLMRRYHYYLILGPKAKEVLPIIEKLLTHKDCGKMFTYTEEYAYNWLSFGGHNLYRVVPALTDAGYRVAITDYNLAFKKAGGWEEVDRIIKDYLERERQRERAQWVQLSLF